MRDLAQTDWTAQFPILRDLVFLNHAAVAPLSARAAAAVQAYAQQAQTRSYVGADWYKQAHRVKTLAARLLNAPGFPTTPGTPGTPGSPGSSGNGAASIAFIANTSTGLSMVAKGLAWRPGDNVVISNVEYPANRYPWEDLRRFGVELREVAQLSGGRIDPEDVLEAITDRTRIVALSHVQFASGFRTPLKPISDVAHRVGGYLCVDAIQSAGVIPLDVQAMGIDFLAADGHKWLLSPEGCGILYCRPDLIEDLHPNVVGWMNMVHAMDYDHYEFTFQCDARRFEPGSYAIPGVLGLGASLELLLEVGIENIWARVLAITDRLCQGLKDRGYRIFSPRDAKGQESSGIVAFSPPPATVRATPPIERIVADLEQQGIIITVRGGRLRASPHFYNSDAQIDRLIAALP
jgi:selenocysteine lyase/cysteine desulfurase